MLLPSLEAEDGDCKLLGSLNAMIAELMAKSAPQGTPLPCQRSVMFSLARWRNDRKKLAVVGLYCFHLIILIAANFRVCTGFSFQSCSYHDHHNAALLLPNLPPRHPPSTSTRLLFYRDYQSLFTSSTMTKRRFVNTQGMSSSATDDGDVKESRHHDQSIHEDSRDATTSTSSSSISSTSFNAPGNHDPLATLLSLLSPSPQTAVDRMSSTDLAYIGDVVYEMLVRCQKVWPPKRTSDLQNQVVRLVRAEHQAALVTCLRQQSSFSSTTSTEVATTSNQSPNKITTATNNHKETSSPTFCLTANEERVLNRGRNAGAKTNHRKSNPVAYQDATALEALLGYLYITDRVRCTQLLQWIQYHLERIP